jgi:transcriptional regulator with XRE-family HTH domain
LYQKFTVLSKKRGLSAYAVSKITGIPQSTFSDWKKGKSSPKLDKLMKIADCLGVTLDEFIKEEVIKTE